MRGAEGHELVAGAVGATAVVAGAAAGPLWAAAFELASAAVTAGIAAHAIDRIACELDASSQNVVFRVARREAKRPRAPLAARALEAACRAWAGDPRALRSVAMLVGQATSENVRDIALALTSLWGSPLRGVARLAAPVGAARAAFDGAGFVRSMMDAAREELRPAPFAEGVVIRFESSEVWEMAA